jgi:parallel beta-helix repeat protein
VRRIVRISSVVLIALAVALEFAGLAAAQPPSKPQPVNTKECTPGSSDGYQLCSSDKGTLQFVEAPGGPPSYRLSVTLVRELKHNGELLYRTDEQHIELDLSKKGNSYTFVRAGAAIIAGSATCTFDDSSAVVNNALRRELSNLACASAVGSGATAGAAAKPAPAPAPAPLPSYDDYSALNAALNGVTPAIRYGAKGDGSPLGNANCPSPLAGSDFQTKINAAATGSLVCIQAGDYSSSTMTVNKGMTVRAVGVVKVKNIVIGGTVPATVDGFNVVGGTLGSPNYAVKFSGTGHQIINNLVRGRGIWYGIGCEQSLGCGTNVRLAGNTLTGLHNFGIYLWGGSGIVVERNNIFDLYQSKDVDDVDAMRAWGDNHIVRNNYIHDINGKKSAGSPHSDCYQTYQAGSSARPSSSIAYENNYCVRVTGQCFIAQNDQRAAAELKNFTLRGNVCQTGGWQSIEMTGIPGITMDNNLVAGVQTTVLNVANGSPNGTSSNVKLRNNIWVRGLSGSRFVDVPVDHPLLDNTANRPLVDTTVASKYNTFIADTTGFYPPLTASDFNSYWRDIAKKVAPVDQGETPNSGAWATDVDGAARLQGAKYDIGPFEIQ